MYLKVSDGTDEAFELCKKAADTAAAHMVGALDRSILRLLPYFQIIAIFLIHMIAVGIHQYAFLPAVAGGLVRNNGQPSRGTKIAIIKLNFAGWAEKGL
jgi:hypothetical protein